MSDQSKLKLAGVDVLRLGYGALRLTEGDGWGPAINNELATSIFAALSQAGISYIDSADSLGPGTSEEVIRTHAHALSAPLIATKAGMVHSGPRNWGVLGRPDYLKQQAYASRLRLGVESIELFFLHRIDPQVPLADQVGALQELREEGVIRHFGVSEPTLEQLHEFSAIEKPAAVQSLYNVANRWNEPVIELSQELGVPFVAFWTLGGPFLSAEQRAALSTVVGQRAAALDLTPQQLLLAFVVNRYQHTIPLFGSQSPTHIHEAAAAVQTLLEEHTIHHLIEEVDHAVGGPLPKPAHF